MHNVAELLAKIFHTEKISITETQFVEIAISRSHLARHSAILHSNTVYCAATVRDKESSGQVDVSFD